MTHRRSTARLLLTLVALLAAVIYARTTLRASGAITTTLSPFSTGIIGPIGIDQVGIPANLAVPPPACSVQRSALVTSVNWSSTPPFNTSFLQIVDGTGQRQMFSSLTNLPTEIKVGAIHVALGGFTVGDVFVGNGGDTVSGTAGIWKISGGVPTLFATFPQDASLNPKPRVVQDIFHDRYGSFGGDLLVLLTTDEDHPGHSQQSPTGQIWRVKSTGQVSNVIPSQGLGYFERHFEGITTVPNLPAIYGPVAGRVLVTASRYTGQGPDLGSGGRIFAINPAGNNIIQIGALGVPADATHILTNAPLPADPEDLDVIPSTGNFYGLDFGSGINDGRILTAPVDAPGGSDFASRAGDVLVTGEHPTESPAGLTVLHWNGVSFDLDPVLVPGNINVPQHWEHVTFGPELQDCPIDLSVTKTVDNATPTVGGNVTFTVTVSNASGFSTATGVQVRDLLPPGLTYVSHATSVGSYNPVSGIWDAFQLAGGSSATMTIVATVDSLGTKNNAAEVWAAVQTDVDSTPANDPNPTAPHNEDDDDNVMVTPAAAPTIDLSLTKTVNNATPNLNSNVVFTVTVANGGPSNATGVAVGDLLPAGLSFVSAVPSQGAYASGTGVWTVGALANGASATLAITAKVTTLGIKNNAAQVTVADQPDVDSTPNNDAQPTVPHNEDDDDNVTVKPQQIDLSLTKTVNNATPSLNSNVVFTITVANGGPSNATGVAVGDLLPAGLSFVSAVPSQGAYISGTGVWTVGALANGASATLAITAKVTTLGIKNNAAQVTAADQPDVDSTPNNDAVPTTPHNEDDDDNVTVLPQQIDLSLTKTVNNATPNLNSNVVFTITVANGGPSNATGVAVGDLLPAGLSFVSAVPSQGAYISGTGVWTVGALASGNSATLTITATVTTAGAKTNSAQVTAADQPDVDSTPNNDPQPTVPHNEDDDDNVTVTPPLPPGLMITKSANPVVAAPYQPVTYTYTVTNTGGTTLTNIVVTDDNGTPNYAADDFTVGTIPSLAPGASVTLTATVIPVVTTVGVVNGNPVTAGAVIVVTNLANGDLKVTYLQDFGINDNTYGTGAIGWPNGHTFGNLTGSDKLEFRFFDKNGNVVLDFYLDAISAATSVTVPGTGQVISYPSGYGTLGPFGGDGSMVAGNQNNIVTFSTSITENLNKAANLPNKAALIVNSPTSLVGGNVVVDPAKAPGGWNHINTFTAVIKASTFGAAGFGAVVVPDQHNSPNKLGGPNGMTTTPTDSTVVNKATATAAGSGLIATATATVSIVVPPPPAFTASAPTVKDKQLKQDITNNGSVKATVVSLTVTWPSTNGALSKVKFDGDVLWAGTIACVGGTCSATLTSAQLTTDLKKKSIDPAATRTLTFEFQNNAAALVGNNYTWTINFDTDADGNADSSVTYP